MEKIIGYCGLICTECPAYLATLNNDDEMRKETAEKWSEMYKSDIKPESINCTGCTAEGVKFHHCSECGMRICGISKGVKNCGRCPDYACEQLEAFFKWVPDAKTVLDEENRTAGDN